MYYKDFSSIIEQAKSKRRATPMAVANCADQHTAEAVIRAWSEGIIEPYLVGDVAKTKAIVEGISRDFPIDHIIQAETPQEICFEAIQLVRQGRAKFLMKGLVETADLSRAILNAETGIRTDRTLTHLALHSFSNGGYHKLLGITDGAIVVNQGIQQKKDILINTVNAMHGLGYECPKIAALCAIEKVNAKMQDTVDAALLGEMVARGEIGKCDFAGPIPFDVAFSAEAAAILEVIRHSIKHKKT